MIIPVGERYQQVFHLLKKKDGELINEALRPTLFVPMTGKAEEGRQVQPDPLHPKLINGSFEEVIGSSGEPAGWYFVRQMKVVTAGDAPEGRNYATFTNPSPAAAAGRCKVFRSTAARSTNWRFPAWSAGRTWRPAWRRVKQPRLRSCSWTKTRHRRTRDPRAMAGIVRLEADERRDQSAASARDGIVEIGLLGGTGEVSYDDVQIRPARSKKADPEDSQEPSQK